MSTQTTTKVIRTEKRVRGPFGKFVKWVFIIFNALMLFWMVSGLAAAGHVVSTAESGAEQAGAALGTGIGASFILFIWGFGDLILGLFVLLTRGKTIITEETMA